MLFEEMNQVPVETLKAYRAKWPDMAPAEWWEQACDALAIYVPSAPSLKLGNPERKWELVSAYQKTVRRGNWELAQRLVSAMCSLPAELPYFWRRVAVTACEDVGPGDTAVMNFVVACNEVFTPKKASDYQYQVLCFLTEMMCVTDRSRGYCMMANIANLRAAGVLPKGLSAWQKALDPKLVDTEDHFPKEHWSVKNGWRSDGLLKFQLVSGIDHKEEQENHKLDKPEILKGLPEYCYDVYTRVGKKALTMLTGFQVVKTFFASNPSIKSKVEILGEALFYVEGCLIKGEWYHEELAWMEQRFIAASLGWSLDTWYEFQELVAKLVEDGAITTLREKALSEMGY